jgi:transcriptional regulator with XRE-family HTH domain
MSALNFCEVMRQWRWASRRELKEVAKEIGISDSTLSRFERGESVTADTLSALLKWLLRDGPTSDRLGLDVPRDNRLGLGVPDGEGGETR